MRKYLIVSVCVLLVVAVVAVLATTSWNREAGATWDVPAPLDADRAIANIEKLCSFGPRPSGSKGMEHQQQWLKGQFTQLKGSVRWQEFAIRHPVDGTTVDLKNMIISFGPATKERLLICAHYDTRPFPDNDRRNPRGKFVGANDGASGPALMIEMANAFSKTAPDIGVDFVLFDAEEFVFKQDDIYFLGSSHFARSYLTKEPNDPSYKAGVLVDMIADKNLELFYEENSLKKAPAVTKQIWQIADQMRIKEFVRKTVHFVRDDHLPLNDIARIPVCDIIDFDYPIRGRRNLNYWHTEQDTPDKCSGESVCKVAAVLLRWIEVQSGQK
jgi:hypothetical protein